LSNNCQVASMKFHLLFSLKTFLSLLFILFLSIEINAQTPEGENDPAVEAEQYVRPSKNNPSDSTQQAIKKLKKQKKKAERQARKLNKLKTKPRENLSKATTTLDQKTDQLIETGLPLDTTRNQNKVKKELNKNEEKLSNAAKKEKSKQLKKAEDEVISTLKNTEEVKEAEQKINELNISLPDSSNIGADNSNQIVNTFNQLKGLSNDTTRKEVMDTLKNRAKEEAKERAVSEASKIEGAGEAQEIFNQVKSYKTDSADADQVAEDLISRTKQGQEFQKLNSQDAFGEMKSEQSKMDQEAKKLQEQAKALQDAEQRKKYAREKASKLANGEMAKFAPQIQQAQQEFTKYKKKVEWIKEGSGPKANSLKDEPFKKRFIYGGNLQIPTLDPFSIIAAPFVGYRINKKFSSGIGATYKVTIGKHTNPTNWTGSEYGYRIFTDYKLIKGWFGHGEFEQVNKTIKEADKDGYRNKWQTNGYIGVGRQIDAIKGLKINVMFLCNFLHEDLKYFDPDAFQFRFGVSK